MRQNSKTSILLAVLVAIGMLTPLAPRAQEPSPPSLAEQLQAQYKLSRVHANGSVDARTVLVVQLAGIQGEPQGDFAMAPAIFKDGVLKTPSGKSNFGASLLQGVAQASSDTSGHEFRAAPGRRQGIRFKVRGESEE